MLAVWALLIAAVCKHPAETSMSYMPGVCFQLAVVCTQSESWHGFHAYSPATKLPKSSSGSSLLPAPGLGENSAAADFFAFLPTGGVA